MPFLSAGELQSLTSELQRCVQNGLTRPGQLFHSADNNDPSQEKIRTMSSKITKQFVPISVENEQSKEKTRNLPKRLSQSKHQHEIFLGGSCNPTTWRQDEAIPLLKNLGITFYNPQVAQWCHELIEQEHEAKQNASVLFYVIDNRTRNVVGIIEAANFAGGNRKLVLVVNPYNGPGDSINGESISDQEYLDLRKSLDLLKDLMKKKGIPTFDTIPTAVTCAAEILCERDVTNCVNNCDKIASTERDEKLGTLLQETFNALDTQNSGTISLDDVCIAYGSIFRKRISISDLKTTVSHNDGNGSSAISFNQFCSILKTRQAVTASDRSECSYDVYLTGEGSEWKENIAKPFLRKHGLSYFIPEEDVEEDYFSALCSSRVLLFVISEDARALTTMTKAAFALGLETANIVLCIQSLRPDSKINGCENLSERAINDYNRGRIYLMDLAKRNNIPVCTDIKESVLLAICKTHQAKYNNSNCQTSKES